MGRHQRFLAAVRARREISSPAHDIFAEGLKFPRESLSISVFLALAENARTWAWLAQSRSLAWIGGWTTGLGPFRSSTDIPSVFSGEVFALLSLATFPQRAMMVTRESLSVSPSEVVQARARWQARNSARRLEEGCGSD